MATWGEAIKGFLVALPVLGRLVERLLDWYKRKEKRDAQDEAADSAADDDPDRVGSDVRDRMRR
jgi:hypothetical protein